jgi:2-polyprenyl-6-methoxyphenol hydroxylase-like FAD-dependent oxidoreductase
MTPNELSVRCCIAGGGPAGMMLGLLLARAGVDVLVLEKHADFLRDFRGDTIHPSTLEVMHELGLLDELLQLPHQKVASINAQIGDTTITVADFSHLPTHCRFIAFMPQWDFLNFLVGHGKRYPAFKLRLQTEVTGLIRDGNRVAGVQAMGPEGPLQISADLVVGADGRHSVVRQAAGLKVQELGAPMDVLWFGLSRQPGDPEASVGRFDVGRIFIMINRGSHWQCGFVIRKGTVDDIHRQGLPAFREAVTRLAPFTRDRMAEIGEWSDVKLLTVGVDRLEQWYGQGVLCLGDAAHTMSPIGGVGINLAIQDAVAAANLLAAPLREGRVTLDHLSRAQHRRELPTRLTQRVQVFMQDRIITRVLKQDASGALTPPWPLRLLMRFPVLRRIPARVIGMGVRPEHLSPELRG